MQSLSEKWCEKRTGTEERERGHFLPAFLFPESRASYFSSDSFIFGASLIPEVLASIRSGPTWFKTSLKFRIDLVSAKSSY